jgi:hypothetical protein
MVDMSAISIVATSLNTAVNIAKAMVDVRDATLIQSKVFELQRAILDAQQSLFTAYGERSALVEEIRDAKAKIASLEAWEAEKQRYQLQDAGRGTLAYALKEEMRGLEPFHHICATCYQHGRKSILQPDTDGFVKHLFCPECKTKLSVGIAHSGPVVVESRRDGL